MRNPIRSESHAFFIAVGSSALIVGAPPDATGGGITGVPCGVERYERPCLELVLLLPHEQLVEPPPSPPTSGALSSKTTVAWNFTRTPTYRRAGQRYLDAASDERAVVPAGYPAELRGADRATARGPE